MILKTQPRDYQKTIFETAINKNTLVVLPTGVGKTLISLMLSTERLKKYPLEKILILAPTKPLVEQHIQSFKKELPDLFADLQLFTGAVPAKERQKIWQTAEIIFSTPQCVANDLKNYLYDLKNVSLLVIDEAHRCLKNYDYTTVAKFYKQQAQHPRTLGLTASPGSEVAKVNQICKHLEIEEVESRTRDSPDVKPYLQELEFEKVEVDFPKEFAEIQVLFQRIFNKKVSELRNRKLLYGPANKISLLKLQRSLAKQAGSRNYNAMVGMSICAQAIKISHGSELLETQTLSGLNTYLEQIIKDAKAKKSKAAQNLFKSPDFQAALVSLSLLLQQKREHPKIEKIEELVKDEFAENKKTKIMIFTQFRETATSISKKINSIKNVRAKIFVGQAKKLNSKGETSGLSQKEQKKVIEEFREGKINVLVATSIGEEGLDIPEVSAVIFYETIPSAIRKIQRTGRTARLAPGKLIMLITKKTRDEIYHYASSARERKMHKTLQTVKEQMKNKIKVKTLEDFR